MALDTPKVEKDKRVNRTISGKFQIFGILYEEVI
jgi:hypothetical protein